MRLTAADHLGHYEIHALLGAGGMGEVYRATDTRLGREVALKVLPADMAADPDRLTRFHQEARAAAALNHPNIVTLYSAEEIDGLHFFTMELVSEPLRGHHRWPALAAQNEAASHDDVNSRPMLMSRSAGAFAVVAGLLMSTILAGASCSSRTRAAPSYLFLWAGDADGKASDFLAVIDAVPASPRYG
jgi:hypothetical protein